MDFYLVIWKRKCKHIRHPPRNFNRELSINLWEIPLNLWKLFTNSVKSHIVKNSDTFNRYVEESGYRRDEKNHMSRVSLIFHPQSQVNKLSGSPQSIPQYVEVPPNIEAKRIISYF
jgi:hypothetical protein